MRDWLTTRNLLITLIVLVVVVVAVAVMVEAGRVRGTAERTDDAIRSLEAQLAEGYRLEKEQWALIEAKTVELSEITHWREGWIEGWTEGYRACLEGLPPLPDIPVPDGTGLGESP